MRLFLFPYHHYFVFLAVLCVAFVSNVFDHIYTCSPVATEYQSKHPAYKIIKFLALHWIGEFLAIGTAFYAFIHAACAYFTPCSLCISLTPGAFPLNVRTAARTI